MFSSSYILKNSSPSHVCPLLCLWDSICLSWAFSNIIISARSSCSQIERPHSHSMCPSSSLPILPDSYCAVCVWACDHKFLWLEHMERVSLLSPSRPGTGGWPTGFAGLLGRLISITKCFPIAHGSFSISLVETLAVISLMESNPVSLPNSHQVS